VITGEGKIGGQSRRRRIVIGVTWRARAAGDSSFGNEKAKRTGLPLSRSEPFCLLRTTKEFLPKKRMQSGMHKNEYFMQYANAQLFAKDGAFFMKSADVLRQAGREARIIYTAIRTRISCKKKDS